MGHGIMELDKGAIGYCEKYGPTWHGLPQYIHINGPVSRDVAHRILDDVKVEKRPLFFQQKDLAAFEADKLEATDAPADSLDKPVTEEIPNVTEACEEMHTEEEPEEVEPNTLMKQADGAYIIVRPHEGKLHQLSIVGERYKIYPHADMLANIEKYLLTENNPLHIEGVGTLFNGRVGWINMCVMEFQVNGDQSPTETRIMYANAHGGEAIVAGGHTVRIVCNNTLTMAINAADGNQTSRRFRHTANAAEEVENYTWDLAVMKDAVGRYKESMDFLVTKAVGPEQLKAFMDKFVCVIPEGVDMGRALTIARNKREGFLSVYEGSENLQWSGIAGSRYALLQAFTDWTDHYNLGRTDIGGVWWDGINGTRAARKKEVLDFLLTLQ